MLLLHLYINFHLSQLIIFLYRENIPELSDVDICRFLCMYVWSEGVGVGAQVPGSGRHDRISSRRQFSPCKANTFTCWTTLPAQVYSKETTKPGKYGKGKAAVGQLLCKKVPKDFPCKSCTLLRIVFPTSPFPGKCFLLERQGEAEAARHSPTQVNVWILCTKQEKLGAIAFHKDEAVGTFGEPVCYVMYSFTSW